MIGPAWPRQLNRNHPHLLDAALATLVAGVGALPLVLRFGPDDGPEPTGADAVAAGIAFVLLLTRRRAPLTVLALAVLSLIVVTATSGDKTPILEVTAIITLYTVTRTASRRVGVIAALGTAASLYTIDAAAIGSLTDPGSLGAIAWTGMAASIGGAVRTWRDYLAATEERAIRAEATKEEEARRRVAEERLRIARELHDVIAHHIALINVQAGVASHMLRSQPDQADEALGHIREAGRTVLDELGSLLYVLRQSGEVVQPTEPVPGLSRLGHLLETLTAAGLRIQHRQVGQSRPVPLATDLAAYRIIQEGLTNAHKHGAGAARLLVDYRPDALRIEVRNAVHTRPSAAAGTGNGLTGMRERAHAVGGSLHAALEPDGTFHLDARLPLPDLPAERHAAAMETTG
ncbi:sensor histidine kinase [Micromonospora sp. ATCC 39149]|uniref:histidine kinase n=1 Tax=Micromonospora carbonacea TaxID=47853 RepID=A0A7D6CG63_9ACTN|nr:histidine kinase [Micromonospora sp. ATCC 39149]EEP75001.1 sensor histidine kinase [Micromonospora sp. ATCC 39149]QLK00742.1 two-component sensor histidine kinase [Micromonospora carbonacea]